jgi:hypothetical protein
MKNTTAALVIGRWPAGGDPGERFRKMEGEPGYEASWVAAQTAVLVRPTSREELQGWLNDHAGDALCAGVGEIEGTKMRVVQENGRFRIERET